MSAAKSESNRQSVVLVGLDWDVIELIESDKRFELLGVFDANYRSALGQPPALGADSQWHGFLATNQFVQVVMAVDPPAVRKKLFGFYGAERVLTLISPDAHISLRSEIGPQCLIQMGAKVMPLVRVGRGAKIHINATLHHEVDLGEFCTVAPGAQLLGKVVVGEGSYIGAGAIIRQRCKIGRNVKVGAGAVVVADLPDGVTAVGVPATRRLGQN
jgi:sugar O-acyltransferase (sialic acid O-acetyltransferase NeuD family)